MKAIAFVGWSGSGRTTLLESLLPRLARDDRRVGYLAGRISRSVRSQNRTKGDVPGFARIDIEGIARFVEEWLELPPR